MGRTDRDEPDDGGGLDGQEDPQEDLVPLLRLPGIAIGLGDHQTAVRLLIAQRLAAAWLVVDGAVAVLDRILLRHFTSPVLIAPAPRQGRWRRYPDARSLRVTHLAPVFPLDLRRIAAGRDCGKRPIPEGPARLLSSPALACAALGR